MVEGGGGGQGSRHSGRTYARGSKSWDGTAAAAGVGLTSSCEAPDVDGWQDEDSVAGLGEGVAERRTTRVSGDETFGLVAQTEWNQLNARPLRLELELQVDVEVEFDDMDVAVSRLEHDPAE